MRYLDNDLKSYRNHKRTPLFIYLSQNELQIIRLFKKLLHTNQFQKSGNTVKSSNYETFHKSLRESSAKSKTLQLQEKAN